MQTLNWEYIEKPIFADNKKIDGYKGIFRNDNGNLLNVAKASYTPTPNAKFIEITEKLHDITGFPIENYYDVEGGKKILAFLKCTEPIKVCGYDFKDYLMIGNSFDGSTGFFIGNSNIMVRCSNRFTKNFRQLQVNHTKNNSGRLDELVKYFEMFMKERKQLFDKMERFADVRVDETIRKSLLERLTKMSDEEKLTNEVSTRKSNIIATINSSIDRECRDLGDNALGLFHGVTHYTTHIKNSKNKVLGNPFGVLNELNQTAFKFCEELTYA
jgi:Domain of unknown function (DUF932)